MHKKYIHEEVSHNLTAPYEIVPVLIQHFNPKSVIDVGCGIGTFLKVFLENGITNVIGIDGSWVNRSQLYISENLFQEKELEQKIIMPDKYDLIICLEVAEHISFNASDTLIENLISLGDIIIFSAAAKNQGGQNHINEQNIDYWIEKFSKYSFVVHDVFRDIFWKNDKIDWWYRQNMYLVTREKIDIRQFGFQCTNKKINQYIHPNALEFHVIKKESAKAKLSKIMNGEAPLQLYLNLLFKKIKRKVGVHQ